MKNSYKLMARLAFVIACLMSGLVSSAQVDVVATGGLPAASYTTLGAAFTAINNGVHTGNIGIGLSGNPVETGSCVLNASGAGSASYTAIGISPTVDNIILMGPTTSGRGLIELNGADNVTIDGDNPNTAGTNRNMTIINSAANTVNYTSIIRLAVATSLNTNCDNIIIRNLILNGSATGKNASGNTSTLGPENTVFDIYAGGQASATLITDPPFALTSISGTVGSPARIQNLLIENNILSNAARGIAVNGSSNTFAPGLIIRNNTIGNANAGVSDQIYTNGICINGFTNALIQGNTFYIEGWVATTTQAGAISVGTASANGSGATIERNIIGRSINNNTTTYGAWGINLGGGNNHIVRNNFVGTCRGDQTAGTGGFGTTLASFGIRIGSGTGHKVIHNTVHFTGVLPGAASTHLVTCLGITSTTLTGCEVRNNILSNQLTGGNPTLYNTVLVALYLPSGGGTAMNLLMNNNIMYQGSGPSNGIAQVSTTGSAANFYTAANFNAGATTPSTNLRAYTSGLSTGSANDNASQATTSAPPLISATDLHINLASPQLSQVDQRGEPAVGLTTDIDGDARPSVSTTIPDLGADEVNSGVIVCGTPTSLASGSITANSASLSWSCSGCAGTFILEYGPTGFTPGTGTIINPATSPVPVTGLSANTTYQFYVKQDCSGAGGPMSSNAGPASFTTLPSCMPPTALTSGSITATSASLSWTCTSCTGTFILEYGPAGFTPGTGTIINPATSPQSVTGLTPSTTYQFYVKQDCGAGDLSTNTGPSSFTTAAACPAPTGVTVGSITGTTASVTWACATCTGTFVVEYGPTGFALGTGTMITSAVSPQAITGLTPGTVYQVYVRQDCSGAGNGFSLNAGPVSFTTHIAGDEVCTAIPLAFGTNGPYNNSAATSQAGEPIPPGGTCTNQGVWCSGDLAATKSMWFTFIAPASGRVKVQSPGFDTQLAIWSAASCTAVTSGGATLVGANDDDPSYVANGGVNYSSMINPVNCLTPGVTYYVQLDGYAGATGNTTIVLTDLGAANPSFTGLTSPVCTNAGTLTLTPAVSGGVFAGTGVTGSSFNPATAGAGTYSVTYTLNGCYTSTQSVTVNAAPSVSASATSSAFCLGGSTTLTGSGANTYAWTGGVTNGVSFSPTATATYTVTGTALNGCTGTATSTITVYTLPSVSAMAMPAAVCSGSSTTLMGMGASTYSWTGGVTDMVAFTPSSTSTYTVTGTDGNGCTATATQTVTVNTLPTVTANSTASAVCSGSAVTLTGGGASTYSWTGGVTDGVAFTPASANTYTVTGTDVNGCTGTASTTVSINALPTVTASSTATTVCAGTAVTLTGGGATTYSWTGGATNGVAFTPVASDTYTVTGTDGNGCTNTATVTVDVNALPSVSAMATPSVVCSGASTTLMGMGASTYSWTSGVTDMVAFTPSSTSTYTVTGTDGNGCTATATQTVTVNALPSVSAMAMPAAVCSGSSTTLMGMGASTYSWTGGVTDMVAFTPSATTTYTVTGTDGNGCTATATQTVTVNTNPTVSASATPGSVCAGSMTTLTGGGATTYSWTGSVTDGVAFAPSSTATYTVTGTDGNGCTGTSSITLTVNTLPSVTAMAMPAAVCSGSSTTLMGMGATTYSWTGGVTDNVAFTPSSTATYTVTGTDGNGCTATATQTVTVNSLPSATSSYSPILCNGGSTSVTITATGGTPAYTGEGTFTQSAGMTTYVVTDANGCTGSATVTLTDPAPIATTQTVNLCAGESVTVGTNTYTAAGTYTDMLTAFNTCDSLVTTTVNNIVVDVTTTTSFSTITANTATATYQWLDCNAAMAPIAGETNQSFTATADGSYAVEVTENGCVDTSACVVLISTGIHSNGADGMNVYPNPTSGVFTISFANVNFVELVISIVDIQGKEVYRSSEKNVNGAYNKVVDLDELSKGLYYIKVNTGSDLKVQKLTIQ